MSFQVVGKLSDFPEGRGAEVRLGARRIAVFRLGAELFALKNICPHEGELLHHGLLRDGRVACRAHGWAFDLATGKCVRGLPEAKVASYPVRVEGDDVLIDVG